MAKGFGEYSGVQLTPTELSWLIPQRRRIHGDLLQAEKDLRELPAVLKELPARITELRNQLAAVDKTMALHELKVDPTKIRPVRTREARLVPYGHLARTMLNHLRDADGPQSTTEVTVGVAKAHGIPLNRGSQNPVRRTVISGLNSLRSRNLVTGVVIDDARGEKAWSLVTRTGSRPGDAIPASNPATKVTRPT